MTEPPKSLPPPEAPVPRPSVRQPVPAQYIDVPPYGYGYGSYHDETGRSGLLEYWYLLRRRKGTLILAAILGALVGVLVTVPQTPVYQARTTLEIQALNEDFLNMRQVSPVDQTGGRSYGLSDIPTQVRLIQSATLIERVVQKLKAASPADLGLQTGRISAWRRALNLPQPPSKTAYEEALALAAGAIRVRSDEETRIVEILCDSTDPKVAAAFANALADEYIRENLESRWNMAQRTGEWLARQLEDMRIKLERSEDALQTYARTAGLMITSDRNVSEEKLRQIQEELSRAQADRVAKQSRYETARTSPPESLPDVVSDASLRAYQSRIADLQRELAELTTTFTPAHWRVKRVQAQIAAVEAAFNRERNAVLDRIRNEYEEAVRREKLLLADYERQAARVREEAEKAIQYNILKREVETNRQLYEAMLQRVKEASVASAIRASNVRVVDPAKPPAAPYKPDVPRSAALGLVVGTILGIGFVILRDRYDRAIRNPDDAAFYLGLSELGVIPSAETGRKRLYDRARSRRALAAGDGEKSQAQGDDERLELVTVRHRSSALAESFRATLTSILFSSRNGERPKVLVLTSAGAGEGKTTVASNLAAALAEAGQKVLLVDGDMRKPHLHEVFALPNAFGLSDYLRDRNAEPAAVLPNLVRETSVPNLAVVTAGPSTAAATNLLYSPQLPRLLEEVRKSFDMILIDTPPVLQIPDARVLGRVADAVILVVRAGRTTREAAQAVRQRLEEDGIPLLGVILNDWNPRAPGSGYYGYYRRYYYPYYRGEYLQE
ncbi:MAG: polysaccharide biosynthesis tyrosine autokinase [Bryobacterales bacterium]|nr:polysaccharide biosynthesis tyrosine autokinase [Bryobacterales bacterium]